jgi:hypothetical protein
MTPWSAATLAELLMVEQLILWFVVAAVIGWGLIAWPLRRRW